jgi:predicted regulator of Ras-like GTPase activity (Roadblock/LC7/MglB family)
MFELPNGMPVDEEIDVTEGVIQSFAHGAISTWIGKRKTPAGHRLVRAGRIVGWLAESKKPSELLGGFEAKARLIEIEAEGACRFEATSYSMAGLGNVAEVIPEAFEHPADRQGLLPRGDSVERLLSRDLSTVLSKLVENVTVRGAIAVDAGMLIDSAGELPTDAETLAREVGTTLDSREQLATGLGLSSSGHWTLHTGDGALLLAQTGEIAIAVWTEANADHTRIVNSAAAALDGEMPTTGGIGQALPDGFVLREGKGGSDAILSMLGDAIKEEVTGHIQSGKSSKAVSLVIGKGIPVAIYAPSCESFEEAVLGLTEAKRVIRLHRLPAGSIVTRESGTVHDFSLSYFRDLLVTVRTRSESRRANLRNRLDNLIGFEIGMETFRQHRVKAKFKDTIDEVSKGLSQVEITPAPGIDAGLRRRLESAELRIDELNKEKALLDSKLNQSETSRKAAEIRSREATETRNLQTEKVENVNSEINSMQIEMAEARNRCEDAEQRAERLVKRVNELEHQISERAAELAKALGESGSSEQLRQSIEEMALKEAELNSELNSHSENLSTVRQQLEDDERRLRVLQEQVSVTRERYARAQSEALQEEEKVKSSRAELEILDSESKVARRRAEDERVRLSTDEARHAQVQAELRELMQERRALLRELGDLGAKRGHSEAELAALVDKAEQLSQAHEEALADIQEADRIRARLAEEPLAQALLDDASTFDGLAPVLERLERSRSLGYSVTLLDRAVERALQVIQTTVNHVAATPRHLLSSEVMELLERQVPQTAGAVRGLSRWSVQQRLEHQLGETVGNLVIDLERLLEDYERSITMLRRLRNVLEQLVRLGAPPHEVETLMSNCNRPESLPHIAKSTRKLIQIALDDIYLEADQRDAGEAISLEETARVLEELITQLDASGLASGTPQGLLWDFQRDGLLPYEREVVDPAQKTPIDEEMVQHMESNLSGDAVISQSMEKEVEVEIDGWQTLEAPVDDIPEIISEEMVVQQEVTQNDDDERAELEAELAKIDASWNHRNEPSDVEVDSALRDLESKLSDLDM